MINFIVTLFFLLYLPLIQGQEGIFGSEVIEPLDSSEYFEGIEKVEKQGPYSYAVVCIKNIIPGIPSGTYFYKWQDTPVNTGWRYYDGWFFRNIGLNETIIHWYTFPEGTQKAPVFNVSYVTNIKNHTVLMVASKKLLTTKSNTLKCPMKRSGTRYGAWGYLFFNIWVNERSLVGPQIYK